MKTKRSDVSVEVASGCVAAAVLGVMFVPAEYHLFGRGIDE